MRLTIVTLAVGILASNVVGQPCRTRCRSAIDRCVSATGQRRARCKRQLIRLCRQHGALACDVAYVPTTTTTTTTTSLPSVCSDPTHPVYCGFVGFGGPGCCSV